MHQVGSPPLLYRLAIAIFSQPPIIGTSSCCPSALRSCVMLSCANVADVHFSSFFTSVKCVLTGTVVKEESFCEFSYIKSKLGRDRTPALDYIKSFCRTDWNKILGNSIITWIVQLICFHGREHIDSLPCSFWGMFIFSESSYLSKIPEAALQIALAYHN